MNSVDIVLAVILLYGAIRGFFRGFFAELASFIGFIAGVYIAVYFSYILSDLITERVTWNSRIVGLIAFAITFIIVVFTISLAGKFITGLLNFAALGILNKIIGACFGLLKLAFIVSVVIMFFGSMNEDVEIVEAETLEQSILYPHVRAIGPILLPTILREAKELDLIEEEVEVEA